jgi:DNA-binding PadR family transcriptional regulator
MYPILIRLADRGLLEARWEPSPPPGRPARHLYRLSPAGQQMAAAVTPAPPGRAVRPRAPQPGAPQPRAPKPSLGGA